MQVLRAYTRAGDIEKSASIDKVLHMIDLTATPTPKVTQARSVVYKRPCVPSKVVVAKFLRCMCCYSGVVVFLLVLLL